MGDDSFDPLREAPEADALDQHRAVAGSEQDVVPVEIPLDADPADVLEQNRSLSADQDEPPGPVPVEADPADVVDQRRVVPLVEEDDPFR
ncbi:MAG TPA: hypothetical protein VGR21_02805 [Cryptosporangiaceae bacterium]|nr:hypothetical protein [Cryptosporangiaceae bacterium]